MIDLSRRSFISTGIALLSAPAIVRASSLMPIKQWQTFGPNGRLTMQMIADEAARLFYRKSPVTRVISNMPIGQFAVDTALTSANLTDSLENFSAGIIEPAISALAEKVGPSKCSYELPIPPQILSGAIGSNRGHVIRSLVDYSIATDTLLLRFDTCRGI